MRQVLRTMGSGRNSGRRREQSLGKVRDRADDTLVPSLTLIAVVSLIVLTGCRNAQPFGPSTDLLLAVLVALKNAKGIQFSRDEKKPDEVNPITDDDIVENGHKGWFIFRRTQIMIARHATFTEAQLTAAIGPQFDAVVTFLKNLLDPGKALSGLAEPGGKSTATADEPFTHTSTHHFDLENMAITKIGETVAARAAIYRQLRHRSVRSIAWHAAGLHDELWNNAGDGPVLNQKALTELVDRRLRAAERMILQINAPSYYDPPHSDGGRGEWRDGSRVRVFEYPYFAKSIIDTADINHIYVEFDPRTVQYEWIDSGDLRTRFDDEPGPLGGPLKHSADWLPIANDDYNRVPSTLSIATSLEHLLASQIDLWKRSWLFCDHSIAATQLEALRFAIDRRGDGENFDNLVRPKQPVVGAIMPGVAYDPLGNPFVPDTNELWSDGVSTGAGDTGVFDSLFVPYRDLQVGDHCILWNHHMYVSVTRGPWRLENSLITQTNVVTEHWDDKNEIKADVFMSPDQNKMVLSGFGETHDYPTFLGKLLEQIEAPFNAIFNLIPSLDSSVQFFIVPESAQHAYVIRWVPYNAGITGVPWFIFLPRISFGGDGSNFPDPIKMHAAIRHSVIEGAGRGSGYQPIPFTQVQVPGEHLQQLTDGVFFPLYLPSVKGKEMDWDDYFTLRANSSSVPDTTLNPMEVVPEMIPGLFLRGKENPIQVIRPRVRP